MCLTTVDLMAVEADSRNGNSPARKQISVSRHCHSPARKADSFSRNGICILATAEATANATGWGALRLSNCKVSGSTTPPTLQTG